MPTLVTYLFEVSICLFVFYGLYQIVFKELKTFQINRIYLVCIYLFSFAIPLLSFNILPVSEAQEFVMVQKEFVDTGIISNPSFFSLINILLSIYFAGAALMFLRLIFNHFNIIKTIRAADKTKKSDYILVDNQLNDQTFSFYKYLFHPSHLILNEKVETHEKIHISQNHSFDIFLAEFVKVILWFNPLVYLISNSIKLNHEFICDAYSALKSSNYQYANFLSQCFILNNNAALTSNFSYQIKKRIIMLKNNSEPRNYFWKYTCILPALLLLTFVFSCQQDQTNTIKDSSDIYINPVGCLMNVDENEKLYFESNDEDAIVEKLSVYNQWGDVIFQSENTKINDNTYGWNGVDDKGRRSLGYLVYAASIRTSFGESEKLTGTVVVVDDIALNSNWDGSFKVVNSIK